MESVKSNRVEIVELLLKTGADINITNKVTDILKLLLLMEQQFVFLHVFLSFCQLVFIYLLFLLLCFEKLDSNSNSIQFSCARMIRNLDWMQALMNSLTSHDYYFFFFILKMLLFYVIV